MPSGRLWLFGILVTVALAACSVRTLPPSPPAPLPASATVTTLPTETQASSIATTEKTAFTPEPLPTREHRLPTATATPRPATPTPTRAPTVAPTPWRPITHTFSAPFVLAQSDTGNCLDACVGLFFTWGPEFVLFNDGLLVGRKTHAANYPYDVFVERRLSDALVCETLYRIERTGFSDFDATRAQEIDRRDRGGYYVAHTLSITSWTSRTLTFDPRRFETVPKDSLTGSTRPDPWIQSWQVLTQTLNAATQPLQSDRLAMLVMDLTDCSDPSNASEACAAKFISGWKPVPAPWPISTISLAISSRVDQVMIEGPEARRIDGLFGHATNSPLFFDELNRTYVVIIRPMLPHESLADTLLYTPPDAKLSTDTRAKPARTITCVP